MICNANIGETVDEYAMVQSVKSSTEIKQNKRVPNLSSWQDIAGYTSNHGLTGFVRAEGTLVFVEDIVRGEISSKLCRYDT